MEEMNFLGEEAQRENEEDCPKDYIQFARDDFVFTTYKSPKFCGKRPRLNATDETSVHKCEYYKYKNSKGNNGKYSCVGATMAVRSASTWRRRTARWIS